MSGDVEGIAAMKAFIEKVMDLETYVTTGLYAHMELYSEYGEQVEGDFDRFLAQQVLNANAEYILTELHDIIDHEDYRQRREEEAAEERLGMSMRPPQRAAQRQLALQDLRQSVCAALEDHPAMTRENRVLEHLAAMHHARRIFERDGTEPADDLARYDGLMRLAEDKLRLLCSWAFERRDDSQ